MKKRNCQHLPVRHLCTQMSARVRKPGIQWKQSSRVGSVKQMFNINGYEINIKMFYYYKMLSVNKEFVAGF